MSQEMTTALKTAKEIERNLVQHENRLAFVQSELKRATENRDKVQSDIDQKTSDYTIFMGQRDAESKRIRQDALDAQDQLKKDKAEFQTILLQFQREKEVHNESIQSFSVNKTRNEAQMNNIREFVVAVQRACSLLGL